ncbi:unnamed protein product [Rotaria sordida]|uniref:Uncharacterized protein n=2 Tax=Rotaria sordida TaxID=392033 RepID=A0A815VGZ5_9BILA|nr:unnamed protein product [Rotaria sordida]CAF4159975.1 unnamed protein product [Rotaria sordida]
MKLARVIFVLMILPFLESSFYLYNTEDSFQAEFYDCINHQGLLYCRRPVEPITLQRANQTGQCYYGGKVHSFASLQSRNISINTILHEWKSSIEKVEQYYLYMKYSSESDELLCECTHPQSFGKNCEYRLLIGTMLKETIDWEVQMKYDNEWETQMHGDIICYTTLKCNYGLLCLDWREICDGAQQCMFGIDEENCDFIEFNECKNDEYRCMNGMCIPDQYFLDGQFDCLDWSDEIQYFLDTRCALEEASCKCGDRLCPPNQWSCGDEVCIYDRFSFQKLVTRHFPCENRPDQYYLCETHTTQRMWTLSSGRCCGASEYDESIVENRTIDKECEYLLQCLLSEGMEKHGPCTDSLSCTSQIRNLCFPEPIQYPKGEIIIPYAF